MNRGLWLERAYATATLAASGALVYWLYAVFVWPPARAALDRAAAEATTAPQTLAVTLAGYEQQWCFTLFGWGLALSAMKIAQHWQIRRWIQRPPFRLAAGMRIMLEDIHDHERALETLRPLHRGLPPARALLESLRRFRATGDIHATSTAINNVCDAEADRLDSDLSMLRYIVWAIPSIGFIGTVRGIGMALGDAHLALSGDISGVTANLGLAFNSTLTALLISIVLMFGLYQLQAQQDRLMLDVRQFCEREMLNRLKTG